MDDWQAVITRQLKDFDSQIQLLVIHPHFGEQHRVLGALLNMPHSAYIRFDGSHLSHEQLNGQLHTALSHQGQLHTLNYLVLDECDRAASPDFDAFLGDLLGQTQKTRIVALTRNVPSFIFHNDGIRARSRFLPWDNKLQLPDYTEVKPDQTLLEVSALGEGHVLLNGRAVNNWDGTLPRALFFFLIDRGMTTRNQIFETFWPNLSVREATNVFHVTKRKISEVLGFDLTKYWSSFYHIAADIDLRYDTATFVELVTDSAVANQDTASHLLSQAVSLYKNHFLTSLSMPWVQKRRDELRLTYGEALTSLARAMEGQGKKPEALGLYIRASVTNPQREDIARSMMTLYADQKRFADAEKVYSHLESELLDSLGVSPSKETQELMYRIQKQM